MNYKELARFYENIARLWKSGLPLSQGFENIKQGKKGPKFWVIDGLQHHVTRGETLADAMTRFPKFFDDFQVMIIRAAEASGKMVETCHSMSRYYEMRHKEKMRLIAGMIYPVILLHAVVLVPNFKYLVVSSLGKSYLGVVLPPLLIAYGLLIAGRICWKKFCRTGPLREKIDGFFLFLPMIGKLSHGLSIARVFRILSNLLDAGIESVQAARKAALTAGNHAIARDLKGALVVLENGGTFHDYFSFSGVLDSNQLSMVAVGEEGGALVDSLGHMTRYMEEENSDRFTNAVKIFGYLTYFIAAGIVAYTVITFYSSYFSL